MKTLPLSHWLFFSLLAGCLLLLANLGPSLTWQLDLSRDARNSLEPQTRTLLAMLESPLQLTAFLPDFPVQRGRVRDLVTRIRATGAQVELEFIDPSAHPDQASNAGISAAGAILLRYRDRRETVPGTDERQVAAALSRLLDIDPPWVVAVTGATRKSLLRRGSDQLGRFGALLREQGMRLAELEPAASGGVPGNADLVVITGSSEALPPATQLQLQRWLHQGHNLLWLATAAEREWLADALSIRFTPGILVDAAAADYGLDQPTYAISASHPDHPATRALSGALFLPTAQALGHYGEWQAATLARSSARSWNETGALTGTLARDQDLGEERGPLDLALALTRAASTGHEQRVVIIGDTDLFSDASLGLGANRQFGLALVRWLTAQEQLISAAPPSAPDRLLRWNAMTLGAAGLVQLLLLPTALGLLGWWIPRRRRRR